MKTEKIDLFELHKKEYKADKNPGIVDTNRAMYLTVDGQGAPGSDQFQLAIGALFSMAYTIKMGRKSAGKGDYTIGKLEGIYWTRDEAPLDAVGMEEWCWRLMIRTPEKVAGFPITDGDLETARNRLLERKKGEGSDWVVLNYLEAGKCVQIMHVGPYDQEEESLAKTSSFCEENGFTPFGRHHEIYLSDPRRVKPENLKTILRIQVRIKSF